jgi:putative ABC transport system ATP-binding protein
MIEISGLRFAYQGGFDLSVPSLEIARGEKLALVGPSGSGKTTLVYLMTGILRPAAGSIVLGGEAVTGRTDSELRNLRISKVGFIFQEFELLEYLNVRENILLPYLMNRSLKLDAEVRARAETLAGDVGLGTKLARRPGELSQGERQRVATARALVTQPSVIIADEPTGNLDRVTADSILELILKQVESHNATLVAVTHDETLLDRFDRTVNLRDYTEAAVTS